MKTRLNWYSLLLMMIVAALVSVGCTSPAAEEPTVADTTTSTEADAEETEEDHSEENADEDTDTTASTEADAEETEEDHSEGNADEDADTAASTEADEDADEHADEDADAHDDEHADAHGDEHGDEHGHDEHGSEEEMLMLPELGAADLDGSPLQVVATTSIIGDVVAQVGGDTIELTTLMEPGQDPHGYEPAARDLTAIASSDVIFVNGWNLEERLEDDLDNIGEGVPVIAISANIVPIEFGGHSDEHDDEHGDEHGDEHSEEAGDEHGDEHSEEAVDEHGDEHDHHNHGAFDPHVWFSIHNVEQWATNVAEILSDLDPANADVYAANAAAYIEELEELEAYVEEQLSQIPEENRFLVTNHDTFGYFAHEYGFTVLGTVIPNLSTLAEPSAADLASLITEMEEHGVCTVFTETTVSDALAQTVAGDLSSCDEVKVLPLYTGAIGPEGSGADSYISMFRANVDAIVEGLN